MTTTRLVALPDQTRLGVRDLAVVGLSGLRGRPTRAALSALGISIGIAALVAVLGISSASRAGLLAEIRHMGTNLLTVTPGQSLFGEDATLPETSPAMVARIPGVTSVSAVGRISDATVRRTDMIDVNATGGIAVQATPLGLLSDLGGSIARGAWLNAATQRYPTVVLGYVAAQRLGVTTPGTQVYIGGRWFTVVGIMNSLALVPEIERSALVGWPAAVRYLGFDGYPTTLYERSRDDAVNDVRAAIPATANPQNPEEVEVSRPSDALTAQLAASSALNSLLLGLGAVALIVGGVGIANIMVISVLERRQEIGLRRALGATQRHIRLQFLAESVLLSLLGGLAGLLVGVLVTGGYAMYRDWPIAFPILGLVGGVAAAVLVGALAGLYPARRAATLPPTEALASV